MTKKQLNKPKVPQQQRITFSFRARSAKKIVGNPQIYRIWGYPTDL
jgi:hypothetical protein